MNATVCLEWCLKYINRDRRSGIAAFSNGVNVVRTGSYMLQNFQIASFKILIEYFLNLWYGMHLLNEGDPNHISF